MRSILLAVPLLMLVAAETKPPGSTTAPSPTPSGITPAPPFDLDEQALAQLRASIAGKEREPAETVFKNIQLHKGKPAAAILSIMRLGYSKSLGVHCAHCHNTQDWASDEKPQKDIARQMSRMVREINDRHLASIGGLQSEKPTVNCTTCHRGEVKPALDLPEP